jgi:anaerobic magnesium-protoporphyrin IX monomethyl ester cyclase
MRILLINPPLLDFEFNKEYTPPLSLLYLAAVLQQEGFAVRILDLNIFKPWELKGTKYEYCEARIAEEMTALKPSLVGFTCMFSGQFPHVLAFSQRVKASGQPVNTVIGGMHPTLFANEIIAHCPSIDYIVTGEGEPQMVGLASALADHRDGPDLSALEGIVYRVNGATVVQPKKRYLENLDDLPLPAYDLIDFENYYHDTSHWHNPKGLLFRMTVPVISSRSCPNRCNFCANYMLMGDRLRLRSPMSVVDEIQLVYERYGQRHFSFMDDNLTLNRTHILTICSEILRRGLNIQFETPNGVFVRSLNEEVIEKMVEAGWVRGALAIEHGSDYIRNKVMGKKLTREKLMEVVKIARQYKDLYLKGAFIIGMPEETHDTLRDTYELIKEMDLHEVFVTNIMPYPGTPIYEQSVRDNLLVDEFDTMSLWSRIGFHYHNNKKFYIKPYGMSVEELNGYRLKFDHLIEEIKDARRAGRN